MKKTLLSAIVILAALCGSSASAQTNWAIEGTVPSYGEFNAPAPCPTAPLPYNVNPSPTPSPGCPGNVPFPPNQCRLGGSAVDNDGNPFSGGPSVPAMVHTDGFTIEMTDYAGSFILSMPVVPGSILPAGPISGLGYDSKADIIWITDGLFAAGVGLTPCGAPPVIFPAFILPLVGGTTAGGLGWDPCTGTLWFSECGGMIVNCTVGGALLSSFAAIPLGVPVTGLDVNTTNGNIQATDGVLVAEFTSTGVLAAPGAFYLAANPFPVPIWGGPIDGLGFSLRPQTYGASCPAGGPTIGWAGGYPWAGNFGFKLLETGATPGRTAFLLLSLRRACPPLPLGGCGAGTGLWLLPPFLAIINAGIIPGSGSVTVPLPLPGPSSGPCSLPVGIGIYGQFINAGGGLEATDAISFTIGQN
ncbi:MAG: hypothetical protein AB1486_02005 [Planctomycetota bacterium]